MSPEQVKRIQEMDFKDKRHEVTNKTLETLKEVMIQQDHYGMGKYKEPLRSTMPYDWIQMFLEEIADGLKYLQNEMDRKKLIIDVLEFGLVHDNPKPAIKTALDLLKAKGTGK